MPNPTLAIYVHVPFCASKCVYCDFTVSLAKHQPDADEGFLTYQAALFAELEARLAPIAHRYSAIHSVYVGGGTPSLMPAQWFEALLNQLQQYLPFTASVELTFEANPNAVRDRPKDYRLAGMNRVSIGVQSFHDFELKALSRNHTAGEALATVSAFQQAGFSRVSLDLMYGIPQQTQMSWQQSLQQAVATGIGHISLYGLQVEAGTPLERLISSPSPRYQLPSEDLVADAYAWAQAFLAQHGMPLYEISNAARPGEASSHNLTYWRWGDWLAVGPGAHSKLTVLERQSDRGAYYLHNAESTALWLADPLQGTTLEVTAAEALENRFIFGLRTREGVDYGLLAEEWGVALPVFHQALQPLLNRFAGVLQQHGTVLTLNPQYWAVSNAVLHEWVGWGPTVLGSK
ncbi:MAG: radical SAM family heme chaperone HemW [Vampirovibrionales bacterium]